MEKQLGVAVDLQRCMGCHTCAVACKIENNLPNHIWWNRILTEGGEADDSTAGSYPLVTREYITLSCQHCANPACTRVCPVGATYRREEDGVVFQDYDKCIGCRMCMAACPYTGVRNYNWEEPAYYQDFAVGDASIPEHQKHVVEKCTLCAHRLARGEEPACIDACPALARYFGDLNDPTSEIAQLVATRRHRQLLLEEGTNPSVYYLT